MLKHRDTKILQIVNQILRKIWRRTSANDRITAHENVSAISNLSTHKPSQPRESTKEPIPYDRGTFDNEKLGPEPPIQR